jgi:hypothetical protein
MRSRTEYPLATECYRCQQPFGEHCAANDGCPLPTYRGLHGGFSLTDTFLNLEAKPGTDPACHCGHGYFDHHGEEWAYTPGSFTPCSECDCGNYTA